MIEILALASGSRGMAGGQAMDLAATGHPLSLPELENLHIHKTGALIRASVVLGALTARDLEAGTLERLDHYAKCIGLAFQIRDDILDVSGSAATLGKTQGKDAAQDKTTYAALLGLDSAQRKADALRNEALASIREIGEAAAPLRWLADYIVNRTH